MQYQGTDRRKAKRIKVNLVVVYREDEPLDVRIRAGQQERQATMVDISEEGISVLADISVPVGTILYIKFSLADDKSKGLDFYGAADVKGKVLYSLLSGMGHYRLGIQFVALTEDTRIQIRSFVSVIEQRYSSGD